MDLALYKGGEIMSKVITFSELDVMSMHQEHDELARLARACHSFWQSDLEVEERLPYVPFYGIAFKHGMQAALNMPRDEAERIANLRGDE